ncbi:hypothetical protein [Photobacterium sanguinicancri]|uniref:hypothetical protein n=1 Tax=Photobacterium sanguinicancri TaxID=875932 RepID=UPI0026E3B5DA|nr:hypothetical protein [Photobacterium sanguinicancri]MDO6498569.1 hypothetical protein [Photobacterium sanguinicancri]
MEVKAKLSGGLFILMMMGSQLDAKYKIDSIQKAIKSGCSITNCEIVTGEVIKYRSYKDSSKKGYQENEFFIDGYKFSFDEKGETFAYGVISENGGVLIPNSGKYKIYLYNEKIIKLWRLNEQI